MAFHMLQVYPVMFTHHCTGHSMNQSFVRQEADSRATVAGHFCSLYGAGLAGSEQTQEDSWTLVFVVKAGAFMLTT